MLKLEMWKSSNGNIHLSFEDYLHGDDVEIKVAPDARVYVKGLAPHKDSLNIFDILDALLSRECNKVDEYGNKNKTEEVLSR